MIIYGLSNRFYCSCTLVGVLTIPRFWDKFLIKALICVTKS
ncbi:hypothetical protein LEP1GSC016_1087 [Leptospira borgpetersenii serovar Hardjo-bovis str. Sponselee]|uniref:Uncharacterized protein n=1 Tax=Leptospira borgpetersenii serovar Hardjo-bovis str. Sponselee TaxID=1303729 RepID=M6C415_LEPBO|nr:hypothetical protein LEP1GSC016_1087 [Leptospira borgpetersenii serovar Hardjo-bovis str. Sponselee]